MFARYFAKPPRSPDTTDLDHLVARLRADVERLARPRHIRAQARANAEVREYLAERLRELGYAVHEQGEQRNLLALPAELGRTTMTTITTITTLPAVAAHYDSVAATPGADDNASALAVMLELARACAEARRPLAVLAFNGEEEGMLGSSEFVDVHGSLADQYGVTLDGVHVLEMVGFTGPQQRLPPEAAMLLRSLGQPVPERGDFVLVAANTDSGAMFDRVLAVIETCEHAPPVLALRLPPGGERVFPDVMRSDHAPFWRAGLAAMMWTDTAELRNPNYHQPSDTPDTLDFQFMARVCALVLAGLG